MRVHVQNPPNELLFPITPAQWAAAVARSPDMRDLVPSFAKDDAGFAAAIGEAEIVVTWTSQTRQRFGSGTWPEAPRLRIISCTSAGLDRLAPFDWLKPGVALLNNRGTHGAKAGEYVLMALIMLANHLPWFAHDARAGVWQPRFGSVLAGRTVAMVGLGTLGGAAARHAKLVGMRVVGVRSTVASHPDCDEVFATGEIEKALRQAEFLVLACPLTEQTRGLLDRGRLALLPRGAKVVNIARGAVWDQEAACDLLDNGHLGGCVTDVAVPEPLPADHRLWRTRGMFVTPHMSSDDPNTYNDRTLDILFENLRALREGRPLPNQVDPVRGY
jgi:phosphoglycerate dehydrogenase-like enzyme